MKLKTTLKSWPRAFRYMRPFWKLAAVSAVVMVAGAGVGLLEPWPLAFLVDSVLGDRPMPSWLDNLLGAGNGARILFAVAAGLVVNLLINGITVVTEYLNTKLEQRMVLDFRSDLFEHTQRLSMAFHDDRRTGDFMARINSNASSVGAVTVAVFPLVQSALMLLGMFWIAFRLDPLLALLSLTVVPFIYYSTGFYGTRIAPRVRAVKAMEGTSLNIVHEAMGMLRVIVAFRREAYEYRKFRTQGEESVDARVKLTVRQTLFGLVVNFITAAGTAGLLGFGAWRVLSGQLTVGELLVLMSYIAAVYGPLGTISSTFVDLQEQMIALERCLELLDTHPEVVERENATTIPRLRGRITFDHVSFSYPGRKDTLKDISFDALPGQVVAVVGPTGAGKSTLASLIPRFYDPAQGRVLIDDTDVRDLSLESLRTGISIVLQEPLLFSGTIAENIRYGRLDASDEEVVEAAKAANAHDFIERLPHKYKTKLGERGAKLSGGERQRLCVARAFLKDAPIIVLDEPTSSIDSKTESVILEALNRLMVGRTTIMIAHRLSTIRNADQILVISNGELVERGTHDELVARGGLYRQLHDVQTGAAPLPVTAPSPVLAAATTGNGNANGNGHRTARRPRRLDLNRATAEQLQALPGLGAPTVRAILGERERRGRFHSVDDLLAVPGIGTVRLERLRDAVMVANGTVANGTVNNGRART